MQTSLLRFVHCSYLRGFSGHAMGSCRSSQHENDVTQVTYNLLSTGIFVLPQRAAAVLEVPVIMQVSNTIASICLIFLMIPLSFSLPMTATLYFYQSFKMCCGKSQARSLLRSEVQSLVRCFQSNPFKMTKDIIFGSYL